MELLLFVAVFLGGLVLLEKGADLFADKVGELTKRTGASETVIGLVTAGIEWEELVVVTLAAATGNIGIAVGAVIGSCIANITGSFSLGLIAKPVRIRRDDRIYVVALVALSLLAAGFLYQGEIGRRSGLILLGVFVVYFGVLTATILRGMLRLQCERLEEEEGEEEEGSVLREFALAVAGLLLISAGALAVIQSSLYFARLLGVSDFVIGLTLVAIGTTLPDKIISISGALKGRSGVVTANAIGSNIFNLLLVLGLGAVVQPLYVDKATLGFDVPFLLGVTLLMAIMFLRRHLHRLEGLLLLALYLFYFVYNFALK